MDPGSNPGSFFTSSYQTNLLSPLRLKWTYKKNWQEGQDETSDLPRLVLNFNQRDLGRLYQMIGVINQVGIPTSEAAVHPERK